MTLPTSVDLVRRVSFALVAATAMLLPVLVVAGTVEAGDAGVVSVVIPDGGWLGLRFDLQAGSEVRMEWGLRVLRPGTTIRYGEGMMSSAASWASPNTFDWSYHGYRAHYGDQETLFVDYNTSHGEGRGEIPRIDDRSPYNKHETQGRIVAYVNFTGERRFIMTAAGIATGPIEFYATVTYQNATLLGQTQGTDVTYIVGDEYEAQGVNVGTVIYAGVVSWRTTGLGSLEWTADDTAFASYTGSSIKRRTGPASDNAPEGWHYTGTSLIRDGEPGTRTFEWLAGGGGPIDPTALIRFNKYDTFVPTWSFLGADVVDP